MSESGYDVISRPAGGIQIVGAMCSDGLGHFFGYVRERNEAHPLPACGARVRVTRPLTEQDPMCFSCAAAGESWAQGGALAISS